MIWDCRVHALIPRNPIIRRDLYRQQQTTSILRGILESIGVVALALGFLAAMLYCVQYGLGSDPRGTDDYIIPIQLLAWTFHAAAALRLLAAGVFSVAGNGYLLDSEDLRLTPLSNWQLLIAKWWTALHQVRGWILALGIVQLGVVVSTGFGTLMTVGWGASCTGGSPCVVTIYGLYRPLWFAPIWFTPTRSIFIVASAIGIVILETMCCTALGMAAVILLRSKLGLIGAIGLRFAPVIIFSLFPVYPSAGNVPIFWRYLFYTWFSFADGGTGAMIQLAHPFQAYSDGFERGVLGVCAVVGMFLLYLSLSSVTAWVVMRRSRY